MVARPKIPLPEVRMNTAARLLLVFLLTAILYQLLVQFTTPATAFLAAVAATTFIFNGMRSLTEGLNHETNVSNVYLNGSLDVYSNNYNQLDTRARDLRVSSGTIWGNFY